MINFSFRVSISSKSLYTQSTLKHRFLDLSSLIVQLSLFWAAAPWFMAKWPGMTGWLATQIILSTQTVQWNLFYKCILLGTGQDHVVKDGIMIL